MKLHGSTSDNLRSAIASAERLRGFPIHQDTLEFWHDLLAHARAEIRNSSPGELAHVESLVGSYSRSSLRVSSPDEVDFKHPLELRA